MGVVIPDDYSFDIGLFFVTIEVAEHKKTLITNILLMQKKVIGNCQGKKRK